MPAKYTALRHFLKRAVPTMLLMLAMALPASAIDIDGIQPAALDQPRINVVVERGPTRQVLTATVDGTRVANVEAFLDTGASSAVLSFHTVNQLGVQLENAGNGNPVRFTDVGLGGASAFAVSEPLMLAIAPSNADVQPAADLRSMLAGYPLVVGPQRAEVGPLTVSNDLLSSLAVADLDVIGMPTIRGRVIVMDMSAVNHVADKIRTTLIDPRDPLQSRQIPTTKLHVHLTHAAFANFTRTSPASADGPAMAANPFVGGAPNTAARQTGSSASAQGLTMSFGGKSAASCWLLDTGAVSSMISQKSAAALGVHYSADTLNSDHPRLDGVPIQRQFTMNIAGVGGAGRHATGFFLDSLTISTTEGEPIRYLHAPVLVTDITMKDQTDGHLFTLDGVLGMNLLTASAKLDTSSLLPDVTNLTVGAFRYVVIDERSGKAGATLGLTPN